MGTIYDIIGDVHGHADELVELLETLGYREQQGCFRHPERQAVFCGDIIDRGSQIRDCVGIVRRMVEEDAGAMVMGNHEYNAVAFHTECPDSPGSFFRAHTTRNNKLHQATVEQFTNDEMQDVVAWFRQLPVTFDAGVVRVVHACWDPGGIELLQQELSRGHGVDAGFFERAADPDHPVGMAVERVLKGPEVDLPRGASVADREGQIRRRVRIRWFESPHGHTLGSYAFPAAMHLSTNAVPASAAPCPYPANAPPVFFGHYWMDCVRPTPLASNVACLDYSVARGGQLCGYRFSGEARLRADRFVTVAAGNRRRNPVS